METFYNMTTTNLVQTFRFKLSDAIVAEINDFARIHRYDCREDFKEAWSKWITANDTAINAELKRLEEIGFTGDINKKMYMSARYYFKNKPDTIDPPKQRRKYVTIDKKYIKLMDTFIVNSITLNNNGENYKPSNSFQEFLEAYQHETQLIIRDLISSELLSDDLIIAKIKKTFKNRYFVNTSKIKAV